MATTASQSQTHSIAAVCVAAPLAHSQPASGPVARSVLFVSFVSSFVCFVVGFSSLRKHVRLRACAVARIAVTKHNHENTKAHERHEEDEGLNAECLFRAK